jgi:hypothetical protein
MHGVRDELREAIQDAIWLALQYIHPGWKLETLDTCIHSHTLTSHRSIDFTPIANNPSNHTKTIKLCFLMSHENFHEALHISYLSEGRRIMRESCAHCLGVHRLRFGMSVLRRTSS